jgi:hypothetical protein
MDIIRRAKIKDVKEVLITMWQVASRIDGGLEAIRRQVVTLNPSLEVFRRKLKTELKLDFDSYLPVINEEIELARVKLNENYMAKIFVSKEVITFSVEKPWNQKVIFYKSIANDEDIPDPKDDPIGFRKFITVVLNVADGICDFEESFFKGLSSDLDFELDIRTIRENRSLLRTRLEAVGLW